MRIVILTVLAVMLLASVAPTASAQETKAINLALWDPVQIFKRDTAIHGFRFNLIYGNNAEVKGVDLGLANWVTGDVVGIQWGLVVNKVGGDFTGWQAAPFALSEGFMKGIQSGWLFTKNTSGKGLQASAVTMSDNYIGLQLGIVNYAIQYHGIQIGLINIIKEGGMLPFFPIFNFSFD